MIPLMEHDASYKHLFSHPELVRDLIIHSRMAERQAGRQVGRRSRMARAALDQAFGRLDEWVQKRLRNATLAELELWGERVLEARILEEVFDGR